MAFGSKDIVTVLFLPIYDQGFLSIYLYLWFLSSVFCIFQCSDLSPSCLYSHVFYCFDDILNEIIFSNFFQNSLLFMYIKKKSIPEKHIFLLYWLCQSLWLCYHNKLWKILKEIGIPDHLICLLRNLYAGQEATVRTGHGTIDWFQIGKAVC